MKFKFKSPQKFVYFTQNQAAELKVKQSHTCKGLNIRLWGPHMEGQVGLIFHGKQFKLYIKFLLSLYLLFIFYYWEG